jgi:uncharacterized OsmC-like protein
MAGRARFPRPNSCRFAAAGCSAVTADRREGAQELDAVRVRFDVPLGDLDQGQREALAATVDRCIERLRTVSRTLKKGIPVGESFPIH